MPRAILAAPRGGFAWTPFDRTVLLTNLSRLHTDDPARVVQQALHDYVAFALFAAGSVLKREEHQLLARRVQMQMDGLRATRS